MKFRCAGVVLLFIATVSCLAQTPQSRPTFDSFDVATIKRAPDTETGRFFRMQGAHKWVATNFTLKLLIGLAYDLNPKTISGASGWMDSTHFDIEAVTPGDVAPVRSEQMKMLRALLAERFKLRFHRSPKEYSIYLLTVEKGGAKFKESVDDGPSSVINVVYPGKIHLPARHATMGDFAAMLGRAALDRPVVDKTGLTARYDFDLEWAPDSSQFGGEIPEAPSDSPSPPLFVAVREQLGLKLEAGKGMVDEFLIDGAVMPMEN